MPNITIDGVVYAAPEDDSVASKVPLYNAIVTALAGVFNTGIAWTAWTPTWTNLTVGSAVVVAKYARVGKMIFCRLSIVLGAGSSISGTVSFTLPVTRVAYGGTAAKHPMGQCRLFDTSAPATLDGRLINLTTTTAGVVVLNAAGTYLTSADLSSTVPFTWATGDEINCQFFYEAA